jgi:hypothetical protein
MGIKYFCDFCAAEITDKNRAEGGPIHSSDRLGASMKRGAHILKVEILTNMDGTANSGIACRHCIIDAINQLDTRPREVVTR